MRLLGRGFAFCVLAIGARAQWYGDYAYAPSPDSNVVVYSRPAQPASVVVVLDADRRVEYPRPRPITYLIAFNNSLVYAASQYWVDGGTLTYLTIDHERRTAPLSTVDRALSRQLNSEQNVAFNLPAERAKVTAKAHVVRHTGSAARTRTNCICR
jgi:hypothetical protein